MVLGPPFVVKLSKIFSCNLKEKKRSIFNSSFKKTHKCSWERKTTICLNEFSTSQRKHLPTKSRSTYLLFWLLTNIPILSRMFCLARYYPLPICSTTMGRWGQKYTGDKYKDYFVEFLSLLLYLSLVKTAQLI